MAWVRLKFKWVFNKKYIIFWIGEALNELMRERNIPREDLVITTKLFLGSVGSDKRKPNEAYLSRKRIIEGL